MPCKWPAHKATRGTRVLLLSATALHHPSPTRLPPRPAPQLVRERWVLYPQDVLLLHIPSLVRQVHRHGCRSRSTGLCRSSLAGTSPARRLCCSEIAGTQLSYQAACTQGAGGECGDGRAGGRRRRQRRRLSSEQQQGHSDQVDRTLPIIPCYKRGPTGAAGPHRRRCAAARPAGAAPGCAGCFDSLYAL